MRTVAENLTETPQVVFVAPVAGTYRFWAYTGPSGTTFSSPGKATNDLINGSGFRMFVVQLELGDELHHFGGAATLMGAREPDEVPPEEP